MLRTLPTKRLAELEELLPEALSNTTLVSGLECKLNNQTSKARPCAFFCARPITQVPTCVFGCGLQAFIGCKS